MTYPLPAWGQDVEQLQRGLVSVGRGIDAELSQNGPDARRECRQEMSAGQLRGSVGTTANALAVHVDDECAVGRQAGRDPLAQNRSQLPNVDPGEERESGGQSSPREPQSKAKSLP